MIPLVAETHHFNPDHFGTFADLLDGDAESDSPDTLMVACSDHSTAPDNVSFARPGRLYVVQNIGASIPVHHTHGIATLGSIEYAVQLLNVRHAIVCGHLACKAIRKWLQADERSRDHAQSDFDDMTRRFVKQSYCDLTPADRIDVTIREYILVQLANLQSQTFVRERLDDGNLHLHAWLVDDESTLVLPFDAAVGQFVPIETH